MTISGVGFMCLLVLRDATVPLNFGADRAMIFSRNLYLYAFVLSGLVVTAAGVRPRVVAAIIGIAGLSVVADGVLAFVSLTGSDGMKLPEVFTASIERRILLDAALAMVMVSVAGGLCWLMANIEKRAEPGATDNLDGA
jgi:hypothetical protein